MESFGKVKEESNDEGNVYWIAENFEEFWKMLKNYWNLKKRETRLDAYRDGKYHKKLERYIEDDEVTYEFDDAIEELEQLDLGLSSVESLLGFMENTHLQTLACRSFGDR